MTTPAVIESAAPTQAPAPTAPARLSMALVIATTGRPDTLRLTVPEFARQSRPADKVVLSVCDDADVDRASLAGLPFAVEVVRGPKGLCRQRNTALRALGDCDVVVFLDDDFVMRADFLAETEALLVERPDIVVATGTVIADGINGPGLAFADAQAILADDPGPAPDAKPLSSTYGAYGCNMILRADVMRAHDIWFDERLPLYGWLEDIDISRQLAVHGLVRRSKRIRGVHLGEKRGRSPGVKLGYSQVANPIYLIRKGTVKRPFAYKYLRRNVASNVAKAFWPEPWVDRKGRLKGNAIAFAHLLTGRLKPERILDLSS